jgi:hypothetical protein
MDKSSHFGVDVVISVKSIVFCTLHVLVEHALFQLGLKRYLERPHAAFRWGHLQS